MEQSIISSAQLEHHLGGRPLYLWGASQVGVGLLYALRRIGIEPAGFLDKRPAAQQRLLYGKPVYGPQDALYGTLRTHRPFIINATFQHKDEIAYLCRGAGLHQREDFLSYDELCPLDYQVVISGVCNLRCISCPLGNIAVKVPAGIMMAATYERVLTKILRESPFVAILQLYNWGEPLLNPDLPEIIRMTNERNVLCAVSSNLSFRHDFEEVIRARPGCFRVSLSGWEETYANTHTGGEWNLVVSNMHRLAEFRNRYCPEMPVEVTYHLYRHNRGDAELVRALCEKLRFVFRPHLATLLPLDNVAACARGEQLSPEANEVIRMLALPIDEALRHAATERYLSCNFDHALNINWDLTVKHCGLYYALDDNVVAQSYLETPLEEILARREGSRLCRACRGQGLHRFCRVYTDTSGCDDE